MTYFSDSEFECKCGCSSLIINEELVEVLNKLREWVGGPVYITSGTRCEERNRKVGGSERSRHLTGEGADIISSRKTPIEICQWLDTTYPDKYGIGLYQFHVHLDVRPTYARWDRR